MNNKNIEKYYDEVNKIMFNIVTQNIISQKLKYLAYPSSDDFQYFEGRLKMYIEEMITMLNIKSTKPTTYLEIRTMMSDMKIN